jgi:site-specific DNA-methyltransferase (adenine-specific)/adenine-specific DNA-methyltransferase
LLWCSKRGGSEQDNLIVQGDNLHALKALLPRYARQVKCIYIDPPYNTGNEGWVYNDNVNSPEIRRWLGEVVGKEGETLDRHDRWLCMMYPRLVLLRQFLRDDGAIFVSIDDNEVANLRAVLDEIFGAQNLLANCIWQKKYTRSNDAAYFSDNHDHILAYARNKGMFRMGRIERTPAQDKAYKNRDNHSLGPWKPTPLHAKSGTSTEPYTFRNGVTWRPPIGTFRRFNDTTMARLDEGDEIWFGAKGDAVPQRKTFLGSLDAGLTPVTLWGHEVAGDNHIGRDEVKELLTGTGVTFQTPKPTTLLQIILQLATEKDSLVLDSFAGSGSTAHAVLKQNLEDGGTRRFILVEMDEEISSTVTSERVRRVAKGYRNARGKAVAGLGGGFQFCRLSKEPLFDASGAVRADVHFPELAEFVWFCETGTGYPRRRVRSPLLGTHDGRAIYLLYNGILKDKSPDGGNVLTVATLALLPKHEGPRVIYAAACRLGAARLQREGIVFRQTPYTIGSGTP